MTDRPQTPEGGETLDDMAEYARLVVENIREYRETGEDIVGGTHSRLGYALSRAEQVAEYLARSPAPEAVEALREALELAIREGWRCGRDSVLHSIAARDGVTPETEDDAVAYIMTADPIRAALSAPRVEAWQPIETAPKDGTVFLAALGNGQANMGLGRVTFCAWDGGWFDAATGDFGSWFTPTHWMPLPAPPETKDDE